MLIGLGILYAVIGVSFAAGCRAGASQFDKPGPLAMAFCAVAWPVLLPFMAPLR